MMYTGTNGTTATYYFRRNLLGDVIGIYNTNGAKVGGYAYDAWGNCTITLNTNGIATKNPIRYRGYYYDQDTGLYYLNARYYSPTWRRFISPDDTSYLDPEIESGLNLYCYCNNDPVNYADPSGHSVVGAILIGAAIGAGISFVFSLGSELYQNNLDFNKVNWNLVAVDTIFGAIDGALSVMGLSMAVSLLIQPALAGAQTVIGAAVSGELDNLSIGKIVATMAFSAIMIGASAALSKYCKIYTGYDTFENDKIRKISQNHLDTVKSSRKKLMYQRKLKNTRNIGLQASLGYASITSLSNLVSGGLGI